jgi:hypothetical protein
VRAVFTIERIRSFAAGLAAILRTGLLLASCAGMSKAISDGPIQKFEQPVSKPMPIFNGSTAKRMNPPFQQDSRNCGLSPPLQSCARKPDVPAPVNHEVAAANSGQEGISWSRVIDCIERSVNFLGAVVALLMAFLTWPRPLER